MVWELVTLPFLPLNTVSGNQPFPTKDLINPEPEPGDPIRTKIANNEKLCEAYGYNLPALPHRIPEGTKSANVPHAYLTEAEMVQKGMNQKVRWPADETKRAEILQKQLVNTIQSQRAGIFKNKKVGLARDGIPAGAVMELTDLSNLVAKMLTVDPERRISWDHILHDKFMTKTSATTPTLLLEGRNVHTKRGKKRFQKASYNDKQ